MDRKMKSVEKKVCGTYESLGSTPEAVYEWVKKAWDVVPESATSVSMQVRTEPDRWSDDSYGELIICFTRPETDEEMTERVTQENMWKENRRQQYEKMRREFGD